MRKITLTLVMMLMVIAMSAQDNAKRAQKGDDTGATAGKELLKMKDSRVAQLHLLTDDAVEKKIRESWTQQRNFLKAGKDALLLAAKGQLSTAAKSLASEAMTMVLNSTLNRNKHRREVWMETVKKQNRWSDSITTATEAKDFYSSISRNGALDPEGMQFDGFSFQQNRNGELAYRIRCCIDTSADGLREITQHGKFRLVVDSLYINPFLCNIPAATSNYAFEFEEGAESVTYSMKFAITASWLNQAIEYFKDQRIGDFSLNFILTKDMLNVTDSHGRGVYEYVAGKTETRNRPQIYGESLIVPRSYLGCIEEDGQVIDVWSTGQFNIGLAVSEQRRIDEKKYWMDKNNPSHFWKNDYKKRVKEQEPSLVKWILNEIDALGRPMITTVVTAAGNAMVADIVGGGSSSASGASAAAAAGAGASAGKGGGQGGNGGGQGAGGGKKK